jgi:hypothetical protein
MPNPPEFDLQGWAKRRQYPDDHKLASRLAEDFQITPHYARAMLQDLKTPSKTIAYIADLLDRIANLADDTQKKAKLLADRTIAELEVLGEHVEICAGINQIIYAELHGSWREGAPAQKLPNALGRLPLPWETAAAAGQRLGAYRRAGQRSVRRVGW